MRPTPLSGYAFLARLCCTALLTMLLGPVTGAMAGEAASESTRAVSSRPGGGAPIVLVKYSGRRAEAKSIRRFNRLARRGRVGGWSPTQPGITDGLVVPQTPVVNDPATPIAEIRIGEDEQAVAQLNNRLAFDLYHKLQERPGNVFFSPLSISTALAMTVGGANHDTRQQIADVLHMDRSEPQFHHGFGELLSRLNSTTKTNTLNLANRLWVQRGFSFESEFLRLSHDDYGADLGEVNFADTNYARLTINSWVEQQTQGRISEILPAGALDEHVRLVLTNAIYFKGTWKYRFAPALTQPVTFHVAPGNDIQVATMKQVGGGFRYAETEDAQLLELPYVGNQLSMVVLLPKEPHGLAALEGKLSAAELPKWLGKLHEEDEVDIQLPRFKFTSQVGLKDLLSSLGMPLAFSDDADFSRLTKEKAQKLFDVLHEAFVEVHEEGTEAAAATGAVFGDIPGPVPQTRYFHADHPFLFLIQDNRTGAILFMGRVNNPNE